MSQSLSGKTAVVTGASSGIGRTIAETLGGAGAHVYLAGRTPAEMEETKKKIEEAGGQATLVACDVRDVEQVRTLVAGALQSTGRVDIMVNKAGLSFPLKIADV